MAESTLLLRYADIAQEVGFFLGYGRGTNGGNVAWTTDQSNSIIACIKSGLRKFYFPSVPYEWSFLRPVATLTFKSGASTVACPEDYNGIEGQVTLYSSTGQTCWPIQWTNEAWVRQRYTELPTATGRPLFVAEQPLRVSPVHSPMRQLFFFPLADQAYTLQFAYYVLPDAITDAGSFHYGGAAHSETIKFACIAAAEQDLDGPAGAKDQEFQRLLQASMMSDRKHKPQRLGYNGDRSDGIGWDNRSLHVQGTITYQGTQY